MNYIEALKECLGGEKVSRESDWWIYFEDGEFFYKDTFGEADLMKERITNEDEEADDWEIVNKVDFITAWAAFLEGKTIISELGFRYTKSEVSIYTEMNVEQEMMGEWTIE